MYKTIFMKKKLNNIYHRSIQVTKCFFIFLVPPIILDDVKVIIAKDGDEVIIPCEADGTPPPEVRWYRDGVQVTDKKDLTDDHGLRYAGI